MSQKSDPEYSDEALGMMNSGAVVWLGDVSGQASRVVVPDFPDFRFADARCSFG